MKSFLAFLAEEGRSQQKFIGKINVATFPHDIILTAHASEPRSTQQLEKEQLELLSNLNYTELTQNRNVISDERVKFLIEKGLNLHIDAKKTKEFETNFATIHSNIKVNENVNPYSRHFNLIFHPINSSEVDPRNVFSDFRFFIQNVLNLEIKKGESFGKEVMSKFNSWYSGNIKKKMYGSRNNIDYGKGQYNSLLIRIGKTDNHIRNKVDRESSQKLNLSHKWNSRDIHYVNRIYVISAICFGNRFNSPKEAAGNYYSRQKDQRESVPIPIFVPNK